MKIFEGATEVYDLPSKPKNFDGWAKGTKFGVEVDEGRITLGTCENPERAREQLDRLRRAYIAGAETFNITEDET